eukprot:jgi/Psemu1/49250/gm1.49250_g
MHYAKNIRNFLALFLPSKVFLVQQECMLHATKPHHLNCFAAAGRLCLINILSVHLPGSNRQQFLYHDKTSMKNVFYPLMFPAWQLKFNKTGNQLEDNLYPFQRLVAFMEQQHLHHDAGQAARQNNNRRKQTGSYNNSSYNDSYNNCSQRPHYGSSYSSHHGNSTTGTRAPYQNNNFRNSYSQTSSPCNTYSGHSGNNINYCSSPGCISIKTEGTHPYFDKVNPAFVMRKGNFQIHNVLW